MCDLQEDIRTRLVAASHSAAAGRDLVRRFTAHGHLRGRYQHDAALLTTELITNVIRHTASTHVGLHLVCDGPAVTVSVRDSDRRPPILVTKRPLVEGGRGVALVDALSQRWGVRHLPDGNEVWFVIEPPARTA